MSRPLYRLLPGTLQIFYGLPDVATATVMMRQRTVMLRELRGKERLDRLARPLMQSPTAFEQQRVIGDLLRERMLKGILRLGKGGLLVDELRRPQVRQEPL